MRRLAIDVEHRDGAARAGTVATDRGAITTPCFMPVGTRGAVQHLASDDLADLGVQVVLANTYHLMLRPGVEVVEHLGGLHGFMDWEGHVLTDSGGYQVFSLEPTVDDDGVTFRSTYDGSTHRLTPEGAVDRQQALGADIAMVLDVCPPWPCSEGELRRAVERTEAWAVRAAAAHSRPDQSLFGIVQGGVDAELRVQSAQRTVAAGFDGYALGGLSVGEPRSAMLEAVEATIGTLPVDQPRYVMGLGDPLGVVECVALGVDLFDCVLPTRHARHGTALTGGGKLNLRNARFRADPDPLDPDCGCPVCRRWSRAYLRHLLNTDEPTGRRLVTLHNLAWLLALVAATRDAIVHRRLGAFRAEVAVAWS